MALFHVRSTFRAVALTLSAAVIASCGSTDTGGTGTTGSIVLALSATSGTVARGAQAAVTGTVTRTGSFTGTVQIAVTGAPAGVTGTVGAVTTTGTASAATVTLNVDTTAVPGSYTLTVHATGTGVTEATATYALFIPASGSFSITANNFQGLTATTTNIGQGDIDTLDLRITRSGFTGVVTLSTTGAPAGLTATFDNPATTGGFSYLTFAATSAVAPGSYPVTLHASAPGFASDQTFAVTVTVFGGTGTVVYDYSLCAATHPTSIPVWAAYQDGTGPWIPVTPTANVFRFPLTQSKGGIATISQSGSSFSTGVTFYTRRELTGNPPALCATATPGTGTTMTGTVAGLATGQRGAVFLGGTSAAVTSPATAFTFNNLLPGTWDLLALRTTPAAATPADQFVLRRDLAVASGGAIAPIDFGGAEAITPATATLTFSQPVDGTLTASLAGILNNCRQESWYTVRSATSSVAMTGLPSANQRPDDLHVISFSGTSGVHSIFYTANFHTFASQTFTMPALMPLPVVTSVADSYKRLQFAISAPAIWGADKNISYSDAAGNSVSMEASTAYLGGASGTVTTPSFTGLAGFLSSWLPASNATTSWSYSTGGQNQVPGSFCGNGFQSFNDRVNGTN